MHVPGIDVACFYALWDFVIDLERKVGGANGICKHERLRI
jgi:hypothetical protein